MQKKKIAKFFLQFFLKCTLYSHILMQTDNAFYGSAQMLKFINEFTKPLNLQRNPKDTYSLHCFFSQKSLTFYLFLQNTLCSSWFWETNKILLEVWHNILNFFTHNLNKHPLWIHEFISKENLVFGQDLFKPVIFLKV